MWLGSCSNVYWTNEGFVYIVFCNNDSNGGFSIDSYECHVAQPFEQYFTVDKIIKRLYEICTTL